jgi:tetratricopeptide (TPR) repeat protein
MNASNSEETVFGAALRLAPAERAAYLDQACGGDDALRQRVEGLLNAYQQAEKFLETPAAPTLRLARTASVPLAEKAGDKIGRYKVLQQIGEGGCGVVYMAEQEEPVRRRVALKVIKLGMDTKQVIARFEAERQALAMMDHPNIAKVLDAGATETGRPYFVMELVRGVKITDYCDEKKLPIGQRLDLFIQVCQAIQHAHQKGVIHRDIKPSNILVTINDGVPVPKVIDFGIAKATGGQQLTDKTVFTAFEQFIGTPAYMSPEQAVITSLDIDTRSDIYALGVLLYELLTGKTPFESKQLLAIGLDEMRRAIHDQEPDRPSTRLSTMSGDELSTTAQRRSLEAPKLAGELRGDLDWVVMKALAKDRARRYQSANAFADDVQRHLRHEPVTAAAPTARYRLGKYARRHRVGLAAAAAIVLALVAGTVMSAWQAVRATKAERVAREQRGQAVVERDRARKAEQEAKDERAVSDAVREFLQQDLLAQASPESAPEPDLKLRSVLDLASEKVEGRFTNQPLVEAGIRMTLAETYHSLGEYAAMERHARRALELYRARLGETNALTLGAMSTLGDAYQHNGQATDAILLLERALELHQHALGHEHPDTLINMNNLALAYQEAGRLAEAVRLSEETLKLRKARLGSEHDDTLTSVNNLACAYLAAERFNEAAPLLEETVKLRKSRFGPDNPGTLISMVNLTFAYHGAGRLNEALGLGEEALKLCKAKLGPEHPYTLTIMNNLATAYQDAGRLNEALPLFEESLKLGKAKLGPEHPQTLSGMNNLARAYWKAGRLNEALPLFEESLNLRKAKLGPEHPDTLFSMNNLAVAYRDAGRLNEALALLQETLKLRKSKLGPEHPDTLFSMNNLARVYQKAGRWDEALPLYEETLKLRKSKLGPEHPDTLMSMNNLAEAYREAGRLNEVLALNEETLKLKESKLGPEHPDTLTGMNELAQAYQKAGRSADAERVFNDVLTPAFASQPQSSGVLLARATFFARRARWKEAAADLGRALDLHPDDHSIWHSLAALLVQSGQLNAYREHCRKSLERFGNTADPTTAERIAKDCLILPASGAGLETVARMTQTALSSTNYPHDRAWCQLAQGLADYRQGHFASALDWAEKALTGTGADPSRDVEACMVQAMACQRLNQPDKAHAALARGSEMASAKLPKLEDGDLGGGWLDWIIAQALLGEARALIEGRPVTARDTGK